MLLDLLKFSVIVFSYIVLKSTQTSLIIFFVFSIKFKKI